MWPIDLTASKKTYLYTAFSRKVVGKSARDNPERYCGSFEFTVLQRNLKEWHERPWTLKESNKSRFDSYIVRNSVLLISHITFRDCRVHIFPTTFLEIAVCT